MNQTKIYESVSDYVDGKMTNEQLKDFEKILTKDKHLKKEVDDIRHLLRDIKSVDTIKLNSDFDYKLREAIKGEAGKKGYIYKMFSIFDRPAIAAVGSVAAALVLVVMTTVFFSGESNNSSNAEPKESLLEGQTISDFEEEDDDNKNMFDAYDTQQVGNDGESY